MKAPKKVYLHLTTGSRLFNGKYYEYKPAKIRFDDKIIEYIRKDAFMKKACEWLNKELPITDLSPSNMLDIAFKVFDKECKKVFIEDFKKYMKGE